jgi:hypothetical protein
MPATPRRRSGVAVPLLSALATIPVALTALPIWLGIAASVIVVLGLVVVTAVLFSRRPEPALRLLALLTGTVRPAQPAPANTEASTVRLPRPALPPPAVTGADHRPAAGPAPRYRRTP